MKLLSTEQFESLLDEYAVTHMDWPVNEEELDEYLASPLSKEDLIDRRDSERRARQVINSERVNMASRNGKEAEPTLFGAQPVISSDSHSGESTSGSGASDLHAIVRKAYLSIRGDNSIDRVIADPMLMALFVQRCWSLGAMAGQYELAHLLLNARKSRLIGRILGVKPYRIPRERMDPYLFASEIALRVLQDEEYFANQRSVSLDRILCDPQMGRRFETLAKSIAPGFSSVDYRWAAISLRKAHRERSTAALPRFDRIGRRDDIRLSCVGSVPGYFWIRADATDMYIGHVQNLRRHFESVLDFQIGQIPTIADALRIHPKHMEYAIAYAPNTSPSAREPFKWALVNQQEPKLNLTHVGARVA